MAAAALAPAADPALVAALRAGLAARADAAKAPAMQRYMKSALPFYGVSAPQRAKLFRVLFAEPALPLDSWRETALALWRGAEKREELYAALALLRCRRYSAFAARLDLLPVYEEIVRTGAWWDVVDECATNLVGGLLRAHPVALTPVLREWSVCSHMWLRRASIIAQNQAKAGLDVSLLHSCICANLLGSPFGKDFFIQKAIGWALRSRARTHAAEVKSFVEAHAAELSNLSKREALKNIGGGMKRKASKSYSDDSADEEE